MKEKYQNNKILAAIFGKYFASAFVISVIWPYL
ncbi:putative membrane protein [Propionispora sp. 2/2-37]|nr:putative membrane protein [Propionispora sp. 2/2-37]